MVYRFKFVSEEDGDFQFVIDIDSTAKFIDLHRAIISAAKYPDDQMTSFFISDDRWEKHEEITLVDMGEGMGRSEYDTFVMDATSLDEFIEDEGQRLIYVFDPMYDRCFFGSLKKIIPGQDLDEPVLVKKSGKAPKQTQEMEDVTKIIKDAQNLDLGDIYDDVEGYNDDEIDSEGYQDLDFSEGDPWNI